MHIAYVAYGVITSTRAHNLQTVATVDALVDGGARVTFVNPLLGVRLRRATPRADGHLPHSPSVLLRPSRVFELHRRLRLSGRFWSLFLDRSIYAWRARRIVRRAAPDVVICRDLVSCFWLLCAPVRRRPPVLYELHTLEHVMFAIGTAAPIKGVDPAMATRLRGFTAGDFAGYQEDASLLGRLHTAFIAAVERWTLRRADMVLTLTRTTADMLRERFGVTSLRVVPSGHAIASDQPDRLVCRRRVQWPAAARIAVYAGLSLHDKGLEVIFATAERMPGDCAIAIVGPDPALAARLAAIRDERGLQSKLLIVPRVPHDDVREYLRAADVGLLLYPASRYLAEFSSPLKLAEYLACGLPVVATDLAALREVVSDGRNGRLVPADDVDTIARTLTDVMRNPALLKQLSEGALAAAREYHYAQRARRIVEAAEAALMRRTREAQPCI